MAELLFTSPTNGELTQAQVIGEIQKFTSENSHSEYKLIVGTDSQVKRDGIWLVTAIVVHRIGHGARYFYHKERLHKRMSFRERIFYEAARSVELAADLAENEWVKRFKTLNIEIHLDVGQRGKTSELIREVVGMATGTGFAAKIKPDSYGASSAADRHVR